MHDLPVADVISAFDTRFKIPLDEDVVARFEIPFDDDVVARFEIPLDEDAEDSTIFLGRPRRRRGTTTSAADGILKTKSRCENVKFGTWQ